MATISVMQEASLAANHLEAHSLVCGICGNWANYSMWLCVSCWCWADMLMTKRAQGGVDVEKMSVEDRIDDMNELPCPHKTGPSTAWLCDSCWADQIRAAELAARVDERERCLNEVYDDRKDGLPWRSCKQRIRALPAEPMNTRSPEEHFIEHAHEGEKREEEE